MEEIANAARLSGVWVLVCPGLGVRGGEAEWGVVEGVGWARSISCVDASAPRRHGYRLRRVSCRILLARSTPFPRSCSQMMRSALGALPLDLT